MRFFTFLGNLSASPLVLSVFWAGCSFGYQSVYEADVHFEHCYRLDDEQQISIPEKLQCWHEWSQKFTYGQSRDRIEYARSREQALARAYALGESKAPPGATHSSLSMASPQPTNAFASPPPTLAPDAGPPPEPEPAVMVFAKPSHEVMAEAPGATCGGACNKAWIQCAEHCEGAPCRSVCDERYRGCMRTCF